jgi:DNA-binding NtrC family response regulator
MQSRLLLVQVNSTVLEQDRWPILNQFGTCERRQWSNSAPLALEESTSRLVVVDAVPCTPDSTSFFLWLASHPVDSPVLVILPESVDQDLLKKVTEVADDFLLWPTQQGELEFRIARIMGPRVSDAECAQEMLLRELGLANLVGRSPSFNQAVEQSKLFAGSDAPVLISGETGTGKELFAHAIHTLSRRRNGAFIPVDCGSIPEHLAEDELFGHHRGAFTDARTERKGLAAMADGGTLFLDEVDALSLANQAKFLRFLQEGTYRALGADRLSQAKVRAIAATNGSMEDLVQQRQFRSDLYFRLNVLRLRLPPLRERTGDISLLAKHFLRSESSSIGGRDKVFSRAALRKLESYAWPGNVRELFNAVQRACLCSSGPQITPADISLCCEEMTRFAGANTPAPFRSAKQSAVEEFERGYLKDLLARHDGNITLAAREAGKDRRAFGKLAKKYGILSRSA